MSVLDLPLIPDDGQGTTPDQDVAAALASLEDATNPQPVPAPVPQPFGRTPMFDFERGRFVRAGASPVWVTGLEAVQQWCLMAIYSARYAHAVFSAEFGMEDPDSVIGEAADVDEAVSDWGARLEEALLVHDRITAVEDFSATYDAAAGVVYVNSFTVVTDEGDIAMQDLTVSVGGD